MLRSMRSLPNVLRMSRRAVASGRFYLLAFCSIRLLGRTARFLSGTKRYSVPPVRLEQTEGLDQSNHTGDPQQCADSLEEEYLAGVPRLIILTILQPRLEVRSPIRLGVS